MEQDIKKRMPVLVLGDSMRSTLAVIRSLGRHGISVHLAVSDVSLSATRSKYVDRVVVLPSEKYHRSAWLESLCKIVQETSYALLIPTTEGTALPVIEDQKVIEPLVRLAVPSFSVFEETFDKRKTVALAKVCEVPLPKTIIVETEQALEEALRSATFPLVIKPAFSKKTTKDNQIGLSVSVAKTKDEARELASVRLRQVPILFQEYVAGVGVGQEFLCDNGKIILAFQHERVREHLGSGGSTYRMSTPLHPGMLSASKKMLARLNWTGVVMVEYRWNKDTDSFFLIEINGRLWGSLPLPVALSVDFPYALYSFLTEGKKDFSGMYKNGVYGRDVFPDVRRLLAASRSLGVFYLIKECFRAFGRIITGRERWDMVAFDDMYPALIETIRVVTKEFKQLSRVVRTLVRKKLRTLVTKQSKKDCITSLARAKNILFVCYGNINRSAFAEWYARSILSPKQKGIITFRSAGTISFVDREASLEAREVAKKYGVSLDAHRSISVSSEIAHEADIIFYVDTKTHDELLNRFPEVVKKMYPLSFLADDVPEDIDDPYGKDSVYFKKIFDYIKRSVDALSMYIQS